MPGHVQEAIADIAGATVTDASNLKGGFSPGPAARCRLSDGGVVFVKAAGLDLNPISPVMHRQEGRILACLGADVPAPKLIGVFDDGDWVALVIEWIDGVMPSAPMTRIEVDRLLLLVERLASIDGGGAAVENGGILQSCSEAHPGLFGHWRRLLDEPLASLDPWSSRHLEALADLESEAINASRGDRLVHLDLRSDNVIFADNGSQHDVIVDWPGASLGAPWIDLVGLLPALELDGGPTPEEVFENHPVGKASEPDAVTAFVASVAGYFTRMSLLDPPPGLPTVRQFQADQARVARRWLASRQGWKPDAAE